MAKTSELRAREIVNILDGKKLGRPTDLEINPQTGKITALVVPGIGKLLWLLGKNEEIVIPWEKIIRIGQDVILVELPEHADGSYINIS